MRSCLVLALMIPAVFAYAQHDGDLIFGGVSGQVRIVDPTDLLAFPRTYLLRYYPATSSAAAFYASDVGFDYIDTPGLGIDIITDATIMPLGMSTGLRAADSLNTYFFQGATRPTFRLRNASRHKHFTFYILASQFRNQRLSFRFKLASAFAGATPQTDSPNYTIQFVPLIAQVPPFLLPVRGR